MNVEIYKYCYVQYTHKSKLNIATFDNELIFAVSWCAVNLPNCISTYQITLLFPHVNSKPDLISIIKLTH